MLNLDHDDIGFILIMGDEIGTGSSRTVYWHKAYPEWVVKVSRSSRRDPSQNLTEYDQYRKLVKDNPTNIKIPETHLFDGKIVQRYIYGDEPPDCRPDFGSDGFDFCECPPSAKECWLVEGLKLTSDAWSANFKITSAGDLFCIDLGRV